MDSDESSDGGDSSPVRRRPRTPSSLDGPDSPDEERRASDGSEPSPRPPSPPDDPKNEESHSSEGAPKSPDASGTSDSSPPVENRYVGDPPTEEISDGEMEFDNEEEKRCRPKERTKAARKMTPAENNLDISHEDLSDVSDLESTGPASEEDTKSRPIQSSEDREKSSNQKINGNASDEVAGADTSLNGKDEFSKFDKASNDKPHNKSDDVEEQLDFEAEEGECLDPPTTGKLIKDTDSKSEKKDNDEKEGSAGEASSLEEGEVSDDEDRRPEETEPRPVCRFYSRGQCTWGVSCRFLHPGVTDKGNYTMFDMVRSMPAGYNQHPSSYPAAPVSNSTSILGRIEPPLSESAWERGLRTAKEMLRKASKRKEQDTDFEEKKLHLSLGGGAGRGGSLGPEEDDPDLAAYAGYPIPNSPPPVLKKEREELMRISERRYEDYTRVYSSRERPRFLERIPRVSPSPPYRSSAYFDEKLDDKGLGQKSRRTRTTREVIVQRAPGSGRGDDWADPWMRGSGTGGNRSPPARRRSDDKGSSRRRRKKSSSGSSYSSSSSSRSSSRSSNSSARSGSVKRKGTRRRGRSPVKRRVSPTVVVQERRAVTQRAVAMNPPAPSARKRVPSPAATRQHTTNPPAPTKTIVDEFGRTKQVKVKPKDKKMYSKSSSSGSDSSSSSSGSESESHSSSSSDSSKARRNKLPTSTTSRGLGGGGGGSGSGGLDKKPISKPAGTSLLTPKYLTDALNQRKAQTETESKKDAPTAKKRTASSPPSDSAPSKKPVSRREELLKQLKAVEDAIARKRSKI